MSSTTKATTKETLYYAATDPHQLAARFLKVHGRDAHGHVAIRYYRQEYSGFRDGRYYTISVAELNAQIAQFIHEEFQRTKPCNKQGQILQVTRNIVGNVVQALSGKVLVEHQINQPVWLGNETRGPFFAFTNGLVGVESLVQGASRNLSPHCSKWFSQTSFPYDYDANATCSRWIAFLKQVLENDDERIALVQQMFGYCLTMDTTQQRFFVFHGGGSNGKSVALDLLTATLGAENVSHIRAELFAQRFQLTPTLGKLANISYDTGKIDESAEATIKEFTGGDRMYFDRKGIPGVMAYPTARLILATNHAPHFADRSKGIWRRMIVIPFRVSIDRDRQDPHLAAKLKAELPGIFNWSVEGLRDLRRHGQFVIPTVCQSAWDAYKRESNPADEFLNELCETADATHSILCAAVFGKYQAWCQDRGLDPLDDTQFGKELRKVFPKVERVRETTGLRQWRYHGLRLIDPTESAVSA